MLDAQTYLLSLLNRVPTAPFLFVGAGLTRRYLATENWEGLLRKYCRICNADFDYFRSACNGDFPAIASMLSKTFHEHWWKDPSFAQHQIDAKAKDLLTELSSPLKFEISHYLTEQSLTLTRDSALWSQELDILSEGNVDGIITTNWDLILEEVFPSYRCYIGQKELLFANPQSIAEIYKIHGCCSNPNSLVLTTEDYADFNERNPYLAAKLLTVFLEHPVIFIGYSITDANIKAILHSIVSCLDDNQVSKLQDRLIFIKWTPDSTAQASATQLKLMDASNKSIPITEITTPDFLPIYQALANKKRGLPAKILRQLKEQVSDLVRTQDPHERIRVTDLNEDDDTSKIEIVYGVGVIDQLGAKGYSMIGREVLIEDIVFNNKGLDASAVVEKTLPILAKGNTFVPIFKYLREAGMLDDNGLIAGHSLPKSLAERASNKMSKFCTTGSDNKKKEVVGHNCGVHGLHAHYDAKHLLTYVTCLSRKDLNPDELLTFLQANYALSVENKTAYGKLACLYDYLKYGPLPLPGTE